MTDTALSRDQLLALDATPLEGGQALATAAIAAQLSHLPDWRHEGEFIVRSFAFANYYETIAFVNALAWMIHREDHHPELAVSYNRCVVRFNTHSVKGISLNDFICAAHCDAIYAPRGSAAH